MPLTKEQLLIPRYMCTGTPMEPIWPGSIWRGGDIIEESKLHGGLMYCDTNGPKYSDFPHLFRPMPWWEGRKPEDMPEYLVFFSENGITEFVLKVEKFLFHKDTNKYWAFEYLWENERDIKRMSLSGWMPATEQEYLDYIKQKEE